MTGRALLSALGLWAREPKDALLANLAFVALAALLGSAAGMLPQALIWPARIAAWNALFLGLLRAMRNLERGSEEGSGAWPAQLLGVITDSLPSTALALGAYALASAAANGAPFGAGLVGLAAWMGLGALLSLGLAAPLGQTWWAAAWAGLLAAVAFLPVALAAALIASWLGGFWALWFGAQHRGAAFLWAPLLLAPVFTPSFYAAYLYFLAQGIKDRSQGRRALEGAPTLKEILRPWR